VARIAFIGGSGFSNFFEAPLRQRAVETPFGAATIASGEVCGHAVSFLARHGSGHERLSHQVQHRANVWALKQLGAEAIVASTAVGVLEPSVPLGVPILFDDLFFPSNRLPDGSLATFFLQPGGDAQHGHWIPRQPFSPALRRFLAEAARRLALGVVDRGCYAHADGPRFNTRAEHAALHAAGAVAVTTRPPPPAGVV
jgi:5'-methylthioadenosine phosphorylase